MDCRRGVLKDEAAFTSLVVTDKNVIAAQTLAWSRYAAKEYAEAVMWFGRAYEWDAQGHTFKEAAIVESYARALSAVPVRSEPRTTWYLPAPRGALIDSLGQKASGLDAKRVGEAISLVTADARPQGAAALGWHFCQSARKTDP